MAEVIKVEVGQAERSGQRMGESALDAYLNSHRASSTAKRRTAGKEVVPTAAAKPPVDVVRQFTPSVITTPVTIPAALVSLTRLKVAAYCRVSTLHDSQETSIKAQRLHFEQEIKSNPEWEFAGVYLEAGVSGTKTEIRPELQRLIADCKEGRINLILTKSISRFSRNTSDCLEMVRTLTALGVHIRFEKENIDTGTMESEFMLSILACLAENESHSISGNMKWSIRKRFEAGTYKMSLPPYGYKREGDELIVIPKQAEIVRRIFSRVLSGSGAVNIAKELNKEDVPSPAGKAWTTTTIHKLVSNPVYKGDLLYQKTYKDERFRQRPNKGEMDQFYDAGHHEAIITPDDFAKAQAAVAQRAKEVGYSGRTEPRSANRYCFSSILTCKACGAVMHRQGWNGKGNTWVCHKHATNPDLCAMMPQSEVDLKRAFINCLNKLAWSQRSEALCNRLLDVYESMLEKTETEKNVERLLEIERLLAENGHETQKLNAIIMRDRFLPEHRERKIVLSSQAKELVAEQNRILISGAPRGTLQQLKSFIAQWKVTNDLKDFPDDSFKTFVDSCTVNSGKMVRFHFRCGLKLTESLYRCDLEEE